MPKHAKHARTDARAPEARTRLDSAAEWQRGGAAAQRHWTLRPKNHVSLPPSRPRVPLQGIATTGVNAS